MEDREVEPEFLSNLASVFRNISIKQAFNFAPGAERRMIVNRRAKKVARVFFARRVFSHCTLVRHRLLVVRRVFVLRTR